MTRETRAKLRELFDSGLKIREAAARMGWPVGKLAGAWWRMGLRRKGRQLTPAQVSERRKQYAVVKLKEEPDEAPSSPPEPAPRPAWQTRFVNPEDRRARR